MEKLSYLLTAHHLDNLATPARKPKVSRFTRHTSLFARSSETVLTPSPFNHLCKYSRIAENAQMLHNVIPFLPYLVAIRSYYLPEWD